MSKVDLWRLITSWRDGYQRPEMVIDALDIRSSATVAEIGAGEGYWLPWLSKAVGREGKVYAIEVEADKVEALRQLADDEGFGNVEVVLGRYDDPLLPDASVDLVITSKTYHHIEERVAYFRRLRGDLAPGGRVAHLDDRPDLPFPLSWITAGHTSDPAMIEEEMTEAGYRRLSEYDFIYTQSFLVYGPVGAPAGAED
jgi:predicted methyltransferase